MTPEELQHFRAFGFVVLRGAVDGAKLRDEVISVLPSAPPTTTGVALVQYAPMMTNRTPESLALLDRFEPAARELCGGDVFPLRVKGMRYFGETGWHVDSERPIASVGFAAYLDPLDGDTGALRVLPGSHTGSYAKAVAEHVARTAARDAFALPGVPLSTNPGDVIVFDEHLWHASARGNERLQWRVDYVRMPTSDEGRAITRAYLEDTFPPDWDGGYDAGRNPSYGPDWQSSGRAAVEKLRALGVYELARRQEDFMKKNRG